MSKCRSQVGAAFFSYLMNNDFMEQSAKREGLLVQTLKDLLAGKITPKEASAIVRKIDKERKEAKKPCE